MVSEEEAPEGGHDQGGLVSVTGERLQYEHVRTHRSNVCDVVRVLGFSRLAGLGSAERH